MGTRKKTAELVFNLQWRNKLDNGGDRSNVIGMYDTPATTQNFETFKSYLLKNSGVVSNDVKVTYLTDDGAEWVIDSQEFEMALCAFRLKARLGEVIFLKLDQISKLQPNRHNARKCSNDVETQFDHAEKFDAPPEWFLSYMNQFKKEIVDEITDSISSNMNAATKIKEPYPPPHFYVVPKKMKPEPSKRSRKHPLGENQVDKDFLKSLKHERKIEIKLDKLDAKTKKIKEKKQALINKIDGEQSQHGNRVTFDGTPLMNAALVSEPSYIPHMLGGESYLHMWEVINNGKLPWSPKTELRLTWGSAEMKPSDTVIRCPLLQPGEKGTLCVRFQIPMKSGQYESYWNFYDGDLRFGHWLSCSVIVDPVTYPFAEPENPEKQQQSSKQIFDYTRFLSVPLENYMIIEPLPKKELPKVPSSTATNNVAADLGQVFQHLNIRETPRRESEYIDVEVFESCAAGIDQPKKLLGEDEELPKTNKYGIAEKDLIVDLSMNNSQDTLVKTSVAADVSPRAEEEVDKPLLQPVVANLNDDNNNVGAAAATNNSPRDSICDARSEASDLSSGYDVINAPVCDETEEASGYVYITVDGNKLPVPKYILRPDFLANAESAPGPLVSEDENEKPIPNSPTAKETAAGQPPPFSDFEELHPKLKNTSKKSYYTCQLMQHMLKSSTYEDLFSKCKQAGDSTRMFIFPEDSPGFEVVLYPKGMKPNTKFDDTPSPAANIFYYPNGVGDVPRTDDNVKTEMVGGECSLEMKSKIIVVPSENGYCAKEQHVEEAQNLATNESQVEENKAEIEIPPTNYTWARSESQYTFPNMQNVCSTVNSSHLRCDPYGPLEQSCLLDGSHGEVLIPNSCNGDEARYIHEFVPNYQQSTPRDLRTKTQAPSAPPASQQTTPAPSTAQYASPVHMLPENLVNGAVNVASSAINTARSVINMIVPKQEGGRWVNGHWVTDNPESTRSKNLDILEDMGFWDKDLNATLLGRYNDDLTRVISELLQ